MDSSPLIQEELSETRGQTGSCQKFQSMGSSPCLMPENMFMTPQPSDYGWRPLQKSTTQRSKHCTLIPTSWSFSPQVLPFSCWPPLSYHRLPFSCPSQKTLETLLIFFSSHPNSMQSPRLADPTCLTATVKPIHFSRISTTSSFIQATDISPIIQPPPSILICVQYVLSMPDILKKYKHHTSCWG